MADYFHGEASDKFVHDSDVLQILMESIILETRELFVILEEINILLLDASWFFFIKFSTFSLVCELN